MAMMKFTKFALRCTVGWTGWILFGIVLMNLAKLGVNTWALAGLDVCLLIGVSLWIAETDL